jgi:hypothetical protein
MENIATESKDFSQSDCPYSAGELILQSGLYEICHYDEPRAKTVLVMNGVFPFCRRCGENVRYKLIQAVPHISEDPDFNENLKAPESASGDEFAPRQVFPLQLGLAHGFRFWQDHVPGWANSSEAGEI